MSSQFIPQGQTINGSSAPGVNISILDPIGPTIGGAPTNRMAIVGTAIGGPKNVATVISGVNDGSLLFGQPRNAKYDIMTAVAIAAQQGVSDFRIVRVTDGTDASATVDVVDVTSGTPVTGLTLTSFYTGTLYNQLQAKVEKGSSYTSANPTYRISIWMPNGSAEVFDNIGGTGATLWQNMVDAINSGQSGLTGPSQFVAASKGTATLAPAEATYTLSGGTDGNTTITDTTLIGSDASPRTGMYALRMTECTAGILADVTTDTNFATQATFGAQEGIVFVSSGAVGQTDAQAITSRQTVGIDNPMFKYVVGDYCYWNDTYNNIASRLVNPSAFAAGLRAALSPEQATLNKQINSVIATQTTYVRKKRTKAEIAQLVSNGLDVIYGPSDGGNYFSLQTGQNTSSNLLKRMDQYGTLTYYIARSIGDAIGIYEGQLITPKILLQIKHSIDSFLQGMADAGMIGATNGGLAFRTSVTSSDQQEAQGLVQIDIDIANFPTIRNLLANLRNGNISVSA